MKNEGKWVVATTEGEEGILIWKFHNKRYSAAEKAAQPYHVAISWQFEHFDESFSKELRAFEVELSKFGLCAVEITAQNVRNWHFYTDNPKAFEFLSEEYEADFEIFEDLEWGAHEATLDAFNKPAKPKRIKPQSAKYPKKRR